MDCLLGLIGLLSISFHVGLFRNIDHWIRPISPTFGSVSLQRSTNDMPHYSYSIDQLYQLRIAVGDTRVQLDTACSLDGILPRWASSRTRSTTVQATPGEGERVIQTALGGEEEEQGVSG